MLFPLLLPLLPLATAHFQILSPTPRGYNEDTLTTYPCGGQNTPSSNRTMFPLSGGPIQLNMEHDQAEVEVVLGVGNSVDGSGFNMTLVPIVMQMGIGMFCLGDVVILTLLLLLPHLLPFSFPLSLTFYLSFHLLPRIQFHLSSNPFPTRPLPPPLLQSTPATNPLPPLSRSPKP